MDRRKQSESLPDDAARRLHALRASGLLESGTDLRLEAVVHRAAMLFNVPLAAVTLRDDTRQVFKSSVGLGLPFTDDDLAAFDEPSEGDEPLCLLNAESDPRFAANAAARGRPLIRFYAGAPVRGPERQRLGVLCVMDRRARQEVSAAELEALKALAAEAATIFSTPPIQMKPERSW